MEDRYTPMIQAKMGEFNALKHADSSVKDKLFPFIDIPKPDTKSTAFKNLKESFSNPLEIYLDKKVSNIVSTLSESNIMIDMYSWDVNSTTEGGEQVIPYVVRRLQNKVKNVVPVIGLDRWESAEYKDSLLILTELPGLNKYCLRLEKDDIDAVDDTIELITEILQTLDINFSDLVILLDFQDIRSVDESILYQDLQSIIFDLKNFGCDFFIFSGSSVPKDINAAVPKHNSDGTIARKEYKVWKRYVQTNPDISLIFADYGVQHPVPVSAITPNANAKIKYTTTESFYVVRGSIANKGKGYKQFFELSGQVYNSPCFAGDLFSWGDGEIYLKANGLSDKPGNLTTWVSIMTSHHLAYVSAEIIEYVHASVDTNNMSKISQNDFLL